MLLCWVHFGTSLYSSFFFQFFLKATQLEQMSSDYQLIIEQQDIIKNTLDRKQEVCIHARTGTNEEKNLCHSFVNLSSIYPVVQAANQGFHLKPATDGVLPPTMLFIDTY